MKALLGFILLAAYATPSWPQQTNCREPLPPDVAATPFSAEQMRNAEAGDPKSQFQVALAFEFGCGVPANYPAAAKWMRRAADKGYAQAQNDLGLMYRMGEGVPRDFAEAVKWYGLAAKQGQAAAAFNIGAAYFNGEGRNPDQIMAYVWMTAARDAGSTIATDALSHLNLLPRDVPYAELQLSELYIRGDEFPKDDAKGAQWLKRAAEHGSGLGQLRLALVYMNGAGVPQDDAAALSWLHKTIAQLDSPKGEAYFWLAYLHEKGRGTKQDIHQAVKYYELAARGGHSKAMLSLARIYETGSEGKPDLQKAYMWMLLAKGTGDKQAETDLSRLAAQLSNKTIAKAEDKAREWNTKWRVSVVPQRKKT